MRGVFGVFIALGAALLPSVARAGPPDRGGAGRAPYTVVTSGHVSIGAAEEVGDLLVVGGLVDLAGIVRGHIYAVGATMVVRSTAVVLRSLMVHHGVLRVEDGALLPEEVVLEGSRLEDMDGRRIAARSGPARLGRRGTELVVARARSSTTALALMRSVLPFDRFVPAEGRAIEALEAWHPAGLEIVRRDDAPKEILVGGLARITFVTDKVKGAFQRGYQGSRGSALFSVVKLEDEAAARALYDEVDRAVPAAKVSLSVKTALGGGEHWYFRRKGRHNMLWQRGPWVIAVETKLAASSATIAEERQFSERVLDELRSSLRTLEVKARAGDQSGEGAKR